MLPALSTKCLFSPVSCSQGKQGMEKHSQKSQLSSIPARMVQQLPVLQDKHHLCATPWCFHHRVRHPGTRSG